MNEYLMHKYLMNNGHRFNSLNLDISISLLGEDYILNNFYLLLINKF